MCPMLQNLRKFMSDKKALSIGIVLGVLILVCLCCIAVITGGALAVQEYFKDFDLASEYDFGASTVPTPTPHVLETWEISPENFDTASQTIEILENEVVPENNPAELAVRLGMVAGEVPETYPDENAPYQVGARKDFWVINTSTNVNSQVPAVLRYVTDHAYFWIGEDVQYRESDLRELAETFENQIYPTTREFFGSEWTPGIDDDPHIYILYVTGVGFSTAGYFSSSDSLHPLAHEYSNAHELFVFNADNSPLDAEYTYGVLAHEFQHMIHWHRDRNETSWINEGFSEISTLINNFDPGGFDYYFMSNPDLQLNDWPNDSGSTAPHYGASFLFLTYFLDRMGTEAAQALVEHPENGMKSIDLLLTEMNAENSFTGELLTADDLVLDWALTNYLHNDSMMDGRFAYQSYATPPRANPTETFYTCPISLLPRTVSQYGTDYIRFACDGEYTLRFEGALKSTLLPTVAHSGDYSFWSNKGDESDMTLTQQFDFSGVEGPLTLSYQTWYDIEEDYDYLYLLASYDGLKWEIIQAPSSTDADPSGNSYGWAYNGLSGSSPDWIREEVDISRFAGQQVWLRFEYITDAAVNGEGFLLDDIAIPEIGYFNDFEDDEGGWDGEGFVRVPNLLPQTFRLALIYEGKDSRVEYLELDADNTLEIDIRIGGDVDAVTLVVVGTTRYTRQLAPYQFEVLGK
jgi:hypothetical protein